MKPFLIYLTEKEDSALRLYAFKNKKKITAVIRELVEEHIVKKRK